MAVTKKDVFDAINQLHDQSLIATNQAILEITGGSNATIQKYRKEFFDAKTAHAVKESIVLKDAEVSVLTQAFSELLKNRVGGLSSEFDNATGQLNESLSESSSRNDALTATVENQQKQLAEAQQLIVQLKNQIDFAKEAHAAEKTELSTKIGELNELAYTQKGRADLLEERLKQFERLNEK
jgi:hypothetical protein